LEGRKKEIRKGRPLWKVMVKIGLERIDTQEGVTVEVLLDSRAMGLVMSSVRRGSHRGRSPQDGLGDEQTCGTTLASAYVLRCLSAAWSQLQMKEKKSEWK